MQADSTSKVIADQALVAEWRQRSPAACVHLDEGKAARQIAKHTPKHSTCMSQLNDSDLQAKCLLMSTQELQTTAAVNSPPFVMLAAAHK